MSDGAGRISLWLALSYSVGVGVVSAGTQAVLAIASADVCEKMSGNVNGTASAECNQVGTDVVSAYILTYSVFGVFGAFLADTRFGHARTQLLSSLVWFAGMCSLSIVLKRGTALVVVALLVTSAAFGTV